MSILQSYNKRNCSESIKLVNLKDIESIERDITDPFKHMIVYIKYNGEEKSRQVPACDSQKIFEEETKKWLSQENQ